MHSAKTVSAIGFRMNIIFNGETKEIKEGAFVSDLINEMSSLLPKMFVIELNEQVIYKENYDITRLSEGDKLEVVVFADGN